ncbi:hypothetical protein OYT13_16640 [Pandoraea sp. XJJ-1]|uniref:hypothetical protein n=1 Tax=Pandoraea sp. XJJ-1 TaxID=3002643 RepID=UPI00227F330B|nr:hypothetical protein [Pandoraea sp. XJJ-1]WAL81467.1 hypothetical protein OYT13_16640 [Pandoraea sp. XJJ-1]
MNRLITQIGQSIYEWFFTKPAQDSMVALGKLSAAVLGTSPIANGLACTPTSPATLQVTIGAGELYALAPLEASVYGTLPADTTHQVVKQGISLDPVLVSCAPPLTAGQAINYLIQVQYQDQDVSLDPTTGSSTPVVLQFYNSSNPSQPWQGPNDSGQTSNTIRKGIVAVQAKAGIAAPTGSQVTPAPDGGWTGLWVVTVANGQTTITAGSITQFNGAQILSETLTQKISQASGDARYAALAGLSSQVFSVAQATQSQHAMPLGQVQASIGDSGSPSFRNKLANGWAYIAQDAVRSLSTSPQYGLVDMASGWASGGAVSAGTITQDAASPVGRTGYAFKLAAVTLTGAGQVSWRYRMDSANALEFKNQTAQFQIAVQHDVGAAINYTVIVRKPTALDNFASTTTIATSASTSVSSGTPTKLIPFPAGQALGDVSNGLEIEVQAACGAITAKNFWFTEWQLEEGTKATPFEFRPITVDTAACERVFQKIGFSANTYTLGQRGNAAAANTQYMNAFYRTRMRAAPAGSVVGTWVVSNCSQPGISACSDNSTLILTTATAAGDFYFLLNSASTGIVLDSRL